MTPEISPKTLKDRIASGEAVLLLDVRQPEEFAERTIDGGYLIPLGELPDRLSEVDAMLGGDKSKELIIYCRSGGRSARACQYLNAQGYNTVNLVGGIMAW